MNLTYRLGVFMGTKTDPEGIPVRSFRRAAMAVALAVVATLVPAADASVPEVFALTLAPLPPVPRVPYRENSLMLRDALNNANKYLLNTWWTARMTSREPYASMAQRMVERGSINDEEIRRYSSAALGIATALATGGYDARRTGVPAATARQRAVDLVTLGVRTHRSAAGWQYGMVVAAPAWGNAWQSALWASQFAMAGWLLGPALQEPERGMLARMIETEARAVAGRKVEYIRDRKGKVIRPGNSGADELAWDGLAAYTAVEMLPHSLSRLTFANAAYERFAGAYSMPKDVTSSRKVNGKSLSAWLGGSNVEPEGWVVNHGHISPDYTVGFSPHAVVVAGLANVGYPAAIRLNQQTLYRNISSYRWPAKPPNRSPGGPVYVPGTPDIYYPRVVDWGVRRQVIFAAWDVEVDALGLDEGLPRSAESWARVHLKEIRAMQRRFTTGQLYGAANEDTYFAREEHAAAQFAYALLVDVLGYAGRLRADDRAPSVKKSE